MSLGRDGSEQFGTAGMNCVGLVSRSGDVERGTTVAVRGGCVDVQHRHCCRMVLPAPGPAMLERLGWPFQSRIARWNFERSFPAGWRRRNRSLIPSQTFPGPTVQAAHQGTRPVEAES